MRTCDYDARLSRAALCIGFADPYALLPGRHATVCRIPTVLRPSTGNSEAISDAEWQAFLAEEITPRFPDGLTVVDAAGQWRDASGAIVRERTKVVLVLTTPGAEGMQRAQEIGEAYRRAFGQESVLQMTGRACVSFQ